MKATLHPEPQVFALTVAGRTFNGFKESGELGPILRLVNDRQQEVYVLRPHGLPFSAAFDSIFSKRRRADESTILAASGDLGDLVTKAQAASVAVVAERRRQVEAEGWTPEHDDAHDKGEMASAAICYTMAAAAAPNDLAAMMSHGWASTPQDIRDMWPWEEGWWKPGTPQRMLEKAAALLIAERERIDRKDAREARSPKQADASGGAE